MTTIPPDTVSVADYERHFHARIDPAIGAYVSGYAADGVSYRENRAAFEAIRLVPRVLRNMAGATARSHLFDLTLDYPIIVAPTAYHRLVHPAGEIATAQAANLTGTLMTVSSQASVSMEDVAARSAAPLWFQLYCQFEQGDTLRLVRRAEDAGYKAIVLTVDAPISGIRNVEQRAGFQLPEGVRAVNLENCRAHPMPQGAGSPIFRGLLEGAPDWATLEWLRRQTTLPLLIKGILHPDDTELAIEAGADGIIVSNHGGRVLDTVASPITVLPLIADRVRDRVPILMDGGIRRGTDILKAIALGASAVLVGRPVLHALHVGGVSGVAHMLTILQTEFEAAMALTGVRTVDEISPDILLRSWA
jgi:L-lactate dehydrogenase (FMN-dependent) and related alpha-hydroxy acid dehydrogenases